jgi:hypothetical protein
MASQAETCSNVARHYLDAKIAAGEVKLDPVVTIDPSDVAEGNINRVKTERGRSSDEEKITITLGYQNPNFWFNIEGEWLVTAVFNMRTEESGVCTVSEADIQTGYPRPDPD